MEGEPAAEGDVDDELPLPEEEAPALPEPDAVLSPPPLGPEDPEEPAEPPPDEPDEVEPLDEPDPRESVR